MQPSSSGKNKSFKSSKDKSFKSSKDKKSDEDSSLERDSNAKLSDDDYSNDFVEESLQSDRLSGSRRSKKSKKESVKLDESGYSEQFDEFS